MLQSKFLSKTNKHCVASTALLNLSGFCGFNYNGGEKLSKITLEKYFEVFILQKERNSIEFGGNRVQL